jgi:hypothetical protein
MPSKIVARFKDGTVLKGFVADINTNKETFHLNEYKTTKGHVVHIDQLKAVFFVKSFEGEKDRKRKKGFNNPSEFGVRTVVKFHDGEIMYGYSQDYTPYQKGFYLFLDDKESNNTKVFVPSSAVFDIKFGEDIGKSEYANVGPKYLKPIVKKTIAVLVQITVGPTPVEGITVTVVEANETKKTSKQEQGASFSLKPGKYNIEIKYESYSIKKTIEVDQAHNNFKVDLQAELR